MLSSSSALKLYGIAISVVAITRCPSSDSDYNAENFFRRILLSFADVITYKDLPYISTLFQLLGWHGLGVN